MGTEVDHGDGGRVGALLRRVAGAFVLGTVLVLAIDALLHIALAAVRDDHMAAPWWVNARVQERSSWIVAALLTWWTIPWLAASVPAGRGLTAGVSAAPGAGTARDLTRQAAHRLVGTAMIAVPMLWFVATLIAFAINVTLRGQWTVEGARLLEPYVYSEAVLTNAPWVLSGATLIVLARHLPD